MAQQRSNRHINQATIVGLTLAVFGSAAIVASFQIALDPDGGWGARIFPLVGAGSILILGALEAFSGLRGKTARPSDDNGKISSVILMLSLAIAYVWLIGKLGYLISTGITMPLALLIFGVRSPLFLVGAAIVAPVIYHLIFFVGLGVFPPYGEWFDLLDLIQGE